MFTLRRPSQSLAALVGLAMLAGAASGCREQPSSDPPVLVQRNMYDQERFNPESYTTFFADHRTMRTPVAGTVSREEFEGNLEVETGRLEDGSGYVLAIPQTAVFRHGGMERMLERGQQRFNIYCAPCHDQTGGGKGLVARVQPGFPPIPNYNEERLRQMPDGQLFATITNGVRNMPSYAAQIPNSDRWAIVAYVRALQLSTVADGRSPARPEPGQHQNAEPKK